MSNQFLRGSQWRKWDLHVHTPASIIKQFKGQSEEDRWERYLQDLEGLPEDFAVIGVNDYLFIDGYKRLLQERERGRIPNIKLLLPVVEYRLTQFAGHSDWKKVNLHVIFSDEIAPTVIEKEFITQLEMSCTLQPGQKPWRRRLSMENIDELGLQMKQNSPSGIPFPSQRKLGFQSATFKEDEIYEILKRSSAFRGNYIIAVGKAEWEFMRWDAGPAEKKSIINNAQFVFVASENEEAFKNAKRKLQKQGVNDLLLDCSDAHHNTSSDHKDRIGNCNTWIKADPTFEGLRQVVFEPNERLQISEKNPQQIFPKFYFSHIDIPNGSSELFKASQVKFASQSIPLNTNMVAIIGGRGTGKSLLLDAIGRTFGEVEGRTKDMQLDANEFTITYTKPDGQTEEYKSGNENTLRYLHVHQSQVKDIVKNPEKFDSTIRDLLHISLDEVNDTFEDRVDSLIHDISSKKEWFANTNQSGEMINTPQYNQDIITRNKKLIASITTESTKQKIEAYTSNIQELNKLQTLENELNQLKREIVKFQTDTNKQVTSLNSNAYINIPNINLVLQTKSVDEATNNIATQKINLEQTNNQIEEELKKSGIQGDYTTILDNVEQYQKRIDEAETRLRRINLEEDKLTELIRSRHSFATEINNQLIGLKDDISNKWDEVHEGKTDWTDEMKALVKSLLEDIEISADIFFDEMMFYQQIEAPLNKSKFRSKQGQTSMQRMQEVFRINNYSDYLNLISDKPQIDLNGDDNLLTLEDFCELQDYFVQGGRELFLQKLFLGNYRKEYLRVLSNASYKGKTPSQLSVGQRGTMYLTIKLATDSFTTPFIFDQPEDDLDNEFIVHELVPVFKKIKKYRQVIIATHNANLVVNADAEQVIVAHNEQEVIEYRSGSLENIKKDLSALSPFKEKSIRDHICDILEGGQDAFQKREKKDDFNRV